MRVHLALLSVIVIWATAMCVAKAALSNVPPMLFVFVRMLLIYPIVLGHGIYIAQKKSVPWFKMIGMGLLGHTLFQFCFGHAIENTSTFHASLFMSSTPVVLAVLGALSGQVISKMRWVGIVIAMVGLSLFLKPSGQDTSTLTGDLYAIGALLSWSLFSFLSAKPSIYQKLSGVELSSITLCTGIPWMALYSLNDWTHHALDFSSTTWWALAFSGLFPILVAYALWIWAIGRVGALTVSLYNFLVPPITALLAWFTLKETMNLSQILFACVVLFGTLIASMDLPLKKRGK